MSNQAKCANSSPTRSIGWKVNGTEEIGNITYQIGIVAYGAETLFAPKKLMAHALIHNGKTKRWACDKTLFDIP